MNKGKASDDVDVAASSELNMQYVVWFLTVHCKSGWELQCSSEI